MENKDADVIRNSGKSLAEQIANYVIIKIRENIYKNGDKLPSMRDLADQFKVSHNTVKKSFVLLKKLGAIEVIPNVGAIVRINHNNHEIVLNQVIAVIIDTGFEKYSDTLLMPLYDKYIELANEELAKRSYNQLAAYICFQEEDDKANFHRIMNKVDAVLVVNLNNPSLLNCLVHLGKPVVAISPSIDTGELDSVCINYFKTYYRITKQIISSGYTRPILFDGPNNYESTIERKAGFLRACIEMGVPATEDRIIHPTKWGMKYYQNAIQSWLKNSLEVDALICVNDNFAIGAMKAIQGKGLRIPNDIALVGGKNTPLCAVTSPELTSVNHFYDRITYLGIKLLFERIQNTSTKEYPVNIHLTGEIVYRKSLPDLLRNALPV